MYTQLQIKRAMRAAELDSEQQFNLVVELNKQDRNVALLVAKCSLECSAQVGDLLEHFLLSSTLGYVDPVDANNLLGWINQLEEETLSSEQYELAVMAHMSITAGGWK